MKRSSKLYAKLNKLHKELCRELGIYPARLILDNEIDYLGTYNARHQVIRINVKKIKDYNRRVEATIAHETYHHYQCLRGWLTINTWKGMNKRQIRLTVPWSKRPWERAAIRYAKNKIEENGWL